MPEAGALIVHQVTLFHNFQRRIRFGAGANLPEGPRFLGILGIQGNCLLFDRPRERRKRVRYICIWFSRLRKLYASSVIF